MIRGVKTVKTVGGEDKKGVKTVGGEDKKGVKTTVVSVAFCERIHGTCLHMGNVLVYLL